MAFNGRRRVRPDDGDHGASGPQRLVAPMPGKIVRVAVKPGEAVRARQTVVVIEAMKMENELRAAATARRRLCLHGKARPSRPASCWRSSGEVARSPPRASGRPLSVRTISLAIAVLVAAVVASLTIDLGPSVRELGERQASKSAQAGRHHRQAVHPRAARPRDLSKTSPSAA